MLIAEFVQPQFALVPCREETMVLTLQPPLSFAVWHWVPPLHCYLH